MIEWIKSTRSKSGSDCVEIAVDLRCIRDSKDPSGPVLRADVRTFLAAVRRGRFDRT